MDEPITKDCLSYQVVLTSCQLAFRFTLARILLFIRKATTSGNMNKDDSTPQPGR